jgi:Tfp pilus assembly protein PilF
MGPFSFAVKVMVRRFVFWLLFAFALLFPSTLFAQFPALGRIIGQIRVLKGDFAAHQILVELRYRGAASDSIYADVQGHFGFASLPPGEYHVVIQDEAYYAVDERVYVRPDVEPYAMVQILLRPREEAKKDDPMGARASGGNPYLVDPADYNKRFPKKALKEYERGVDAERKGKPEEAIAHYEGTLKIAPDYYPAHNNLGSLYLSKSAFKPAEEQFREAVRLDANDAQAYFNLGNVLMMTGRYPESDAALAAGLQRRPDSAFARFLQGCLYERTGKFDEAEKSLREALRLDPSMSQAHLQLVNLYLQQKRKPDAIHQLQDFLKAFPTAPTAAKAKEVLNKLQSEQSLSTR